MPYDFDDAVRILGLDLTDDDVTPVSEDPGPQPEDMPDDARTWELRVYSDRPVFNLARIIREIDPLYTVEIIEH